MKGEGRFLRKHFIGKDVRLGNDWIYLSSRPLNAPSFHCNVTPQHEKYGYVCQQA